MINDSDLILVPEGMHIYSREGWNLLYDPVNVRWIRLNNDGVKILKTIEKHKNMDGITSSLHREYSARPLAEIRQVARQFIEGLVSVGFLHVNEYKKKKIDFFCQETPHEIYLLMTYRCNSRCRYCYNIGDRDQWLEESGKDEMKLPALTFDDYKKLVQEAKDLGVQQLLLTGGEPLLNPISIELGRYISEQGLDSQILTNGLLIDETNAKAIAENFKIISISLDSLNKESHETMRGKGTYRKVLESIKLLKSHGAYIRVTSVITRENVNEILDTWIDVYDRLKCDYYTPALYVPDSSDPEVYGPLLPEMDDLLNEQNRIREHFKDMPGIAFKPAQVRFSCGVGNGEISVSPDGFVFPCHTLHKPELQCGNLREQGLAQIIKESKLLHDLRHFNIEEIEPCSGCDYKYLCAGGCAAMNYFIYGDFYTRNEFYCDYLKQEQVERMWAAAVQEVKPSEDRRSD